VAATSSVRIVKQFTYRNAVRQFSNRYHIGTAVPPDSTHWTTLCDAIVAAEKAIYPTYGAYGISIVEAVGYGPGSEIPVFTKAYSVAATGSTFSGAPGPGDCAVLVRYSTPDRSTKNHPVYCFNYYHGVAFSSSGTAPDNVLAAQVTAMQTYGAAWLTGFSDGTTTFKRSRPTGDLCTGVFVNPLVTHRDLPH
jgi:hypothetical protein